MSVRTSTPLSRKAAGPTPAIAPRPLAGVPATVSETLRSPGQPLSPSTRAFFEPRFDAAAPAAAPPSFEHQEGLPVSEPGDAGEREADRLAERALRRPDGPRQGPGFDFSRVRVHTDARAAASARSVQARAYTVGQDIVFAAGQYDPETGAGRELLAHELAHTTQPASRLSRAPDGPLDRKLPPHVPKAPSLRSAAAGPTPCATTACPAKIPGSAADFDPDGIRGLGVDPQSKPSVHLRRFAAAEAPELLVGVHDILVVSSPEMAAQRVSRGDCPKPPADDPSAGCVLVSPAMEQEAAAFNGGARTVGGQARDEWSFRLRRSLSWSQAEIQFRSSPTAGLPAANAGAMWELQALHGWLAGWSVDYNQAMSAATPEEQAKQVQKSIDFRVDSQRLGVRGMLRRLRCMLSCAEVDESVTRVFGRVSAGWPRAMRDALLFGLMDPKRGLAWPPLPRTPQSMTFPAEPRPKMPPLYVPRGGFEREAGKSGENL